MDKLWCWPQSQLKYLSPEIIKMINSSDISIQKESFEYFSVNFDQYKQIQTEISPAQELDYLKFNAIRNYFLLERLIMLNSRFQLETKITILHRENESNLNQFSPLSTSTEQLLHKSQESEDVLVLFNLDHPQIKIKARNYIIPLIFSRLNLFPDHPINLDSREARFNQKNDRSYILQKEIPRYESVSSKTYQNYMRFITNSSLFEECKRNLAEYEVESQKKKEKTIK